MYFQPRGRGKNTSSCQTGTRPALGQRDRPVAALLGTHVLIMTIVNNVEAHDPDVSLPEFTSSLCRCVFTCVCVTLIGVYKTLNFSVFFFLVPYTSPCINNFEYLSFLMGT